MTEVLQQFECIVDELTLKSVCVRLYDLTNMDNPIEVAEMPIEQFDDNMKTQLVEGFLFYWNIGYDTKENGQIIRASEFLYG